MDITKFPPGIQAAGVTITGLLVVFIALVGLWVIVALFGKIFSSISRPKAPASTEKKSEPVVSAAPPVIKPAMQVEDGISDEVVAVIAAAVTAMSGGAQVAVRSIKRTREARSNWAQAGVIQNTQPF